MRPKVSKFLILLLIGSTFLVVITPVEADETISAGQQVVDYYRNVFHYDWNIAADYVYDSGADKQRQGDTIPGSGYTPYEAELIEGTMSVRPILSPDNSEDEIISLIESATEKLYIETMYIKNDLDDIVDAIIDRYDAGVDVKVIVDESGSDQSMIDELDDEGVPIRVSEPDAGNGNYFDTMHNKGIIADDNVLIASINWSPTSLRYNREAGVIIENSDVADYYEIIFDYDWIASVDYDDGEHFLEATGGLPEPASSVEPSTSYTPQFTAETITGEMNVSVLASPDNVFEVLNNTLAAAQESIDISVYTMSNPYLLDTLLDALDRGVKIRLILEDGQFNSWERKYNRQTMYELVEQGDADGKWESDSEFTYQHSKYAVIDNKTLIISSGNWSMKSCPPEQPDGDVDGNRDWWVIIYGDSPTDLSFNDPPAEKDFIDIILENWYWIALVISIISLAGYGLNKLGIIG